MLFLPEDADQWLDHSEDELIVRRCAYWVSLRGAEAMPPGVGSKTVYLPKAQAFTTGALRELMERFAMRDIPTYAPP